MARTKRDDATTGATTGAALLRGVNVGGKNIVRMPQLAAFFEAAGATAVQTYIQSGNVVFRAREPALTRLPGFVSDRLRDECGLSVPVQWRTLAELEAVARDNPYLAEGRDPSFFHVLFLADRPSPAAVAALDPRRSPPDEYAVRGREIYAWLPRGSAESKLTTAYFDRALGTVTTVRNWRTVLKLLELARSTEAGAAPAQHPPAGRGPDRNQV